MKQIRKILRDKRGEGYIDVAVMVLCVMLVIALGVRLFPIFITKMQVDNFADELVREAEISGRVGSETSNRQRVLEEKTGIHPAVQWSNTGNSVAVPCVDFILCGIAMYLSKMGEEEEDVYLSR